MPYLCGIYKRTGFDDAYNAIKILKPLMTEEIFARNHYEDKLDLDLVEEDLFHGYNNCLTTHKADDYIDTGMSMVKLSLLSIDIAANLDYIKA